MNHAKIYIQMVIVKDVIEKKNAQNVVIKDSMVIIVV
jgi:hypothetical protein